MEPSLAFLHRQTDLISQLATQKCLQLSTSTSNIAVATCESTPSIDSKRENLFSKRRYRNINRHNKSFSTEKKVFNAARDDC